MAVLRCTTNATDRQKSGKALESFSTCEKVIFDVTVVRSRILLAESEYRDAETERSLKTERRKQT